MRTGPGWEKRTGPLHIWDFRGRRAPSDHRGWGLSPGKWEDSTPWAHAGFSPSVPLTAQPPRPQGPSPPARESGLSGLDCTGPLSTSGFRGVRPSEGPERTWEGRREVVGASCSCSHLPKARVSSSCVSLQTWGRSQLPPLSLAPVLCGHVTKRLADCDPH